MGRLTHTVSGDVASFRAASRVPIESLKFHFLPRQEGSGDPSPTNVRPITGWTGLNGKRAGKNIGHIVNFSANSGQIGETTPQLSNKYGTTLSTITYNLPDTELVITQTDHDEPTETSYKNGYFAIWIDNLEYNQRYDVSLKVKNVVDPLNVGLNRIRINGPSGGSSQFPTVIDNDTLIYKNVLHAPYVNEGVTKNRKGWEFRLCGMSMTISEIMVTPANKSDGVFEPYEGSALPLSWSDHGVEYGGYIDAVKGKIVAEYEMLTDTWGNWGEAADQGDGTTLRYKKFTNPVYGNGITNHYTDYCNVAKYVYANNNGNPHYYIVGQSYNCRVYMPNDFSTDQVIQVIGKLITPIEYDIDPIFLQAFIDHNNFWSDANDITEVTYAVTESKDMLATRKKAMDFDIGHHKKIEWDQLIKDGNFTGNSIDGARWRASHDNKGTLSISNNVATWECIEVPAYYYQAGITWTYGSHYNYLQIPYNHKLYARVDMRCSKAVSGRIYALVANGMHKYNIAIPIEANTWTTIRGMLPERVSVQTGEDDGIVKRFRTCIAGLNNMSDITVGTTYDIRNFMAFDLTEMFGLGNEPSTVEEFERICALNGIDLTTYQPYDTGSDRWLIVP